MNEDEIKNVITEGYRNILRREPDSEGLQTYIAHINNGMNVDRFRDALRMSDEYRQRFGPPIYDKIKEWSDKIVIVSTWGINCGIAMYTKDLLNDLEKLYPGSFAVQSIEASDFTGARLVHLQHEFGIMLRPPVVGGKIIITFHSVPKNIYETLSIYESTLNIVAYIVPCEGALEFMNTTRDVHVVKLGSTIMPVMKKEEARKILNINIDKPVGFVFGFQSPSKNYSRLINAARNTNIHIIISGSTHFKGFKSNISDYQNVTFLNKLLTEEEVNLYSLASDLLLFDYIPQNHYSASSALHRTIGAGRPVICANTKHFNDIDGVPKFNSQQELEQAIVFALENQEDLGRLSLRYAIETRREEMAKRHIDIYKRYIDF